MRQIILEIEDSAYEQFMGMVGLCPSVKVVCESGITDVMNDRDHEGFKSPQAFLDYLYEIGIEKLPSRITLSLAYSKTFDRFPDWTFTDMDNPSEILRRKNVVKQFLSAYGVAKRGILNRILNIAMASKGCGSAEFKQARFCIHLALYLRESQTRNCV